VLFPAAFIFDYQTNFMKSTLTFFFTIVVSITLAQKPSPDVIETSKGKLSIQPLNHATLVFTFNGKTIYNDPQGGAKMFEGIAAPDLVLISDIHGDHFNPETLKAIDLSHAKLIVPQVVADKLPEELKSKAVVVNNGQSIKELDINILGIPMYNLPESADAKHTKGRGNGYVLTFGNKKIYLSGDTAGIPEMKSLRDIDVAFVCMNLPYTMDINEASEAVLAFQPKIVYPYHYRGQGGLSDTEAFKKLVNTGNPKIEVRMRNWYAQ
jgi:L-ascorbate metabolism protein UlaG (beta-lactamase superfamily)